MSQADLISTGLNAGKALADIFSSRALFVEHTYESEIMQPIYHLSLTPKGEDRYIASIGLSEDKQGVLFFEDLDVFTGRRNGIASIMTALCIEAGVKHGYKTADVIAIQQGAFFWHAVGFKPYYFESNFKKRFNYHAGQIADAGVRQRIAAKVEANDASAISDILALNTRMPGEKRSIAQRVFRNGSWRGTFDTGNAEQVAQLRRRSRLQLNGLTV